MTLEIQIQVIIFNIIFGMYCALLYNITFDFFKIQKKLLKFFLTLIVVVFNVTIYFILLFFINSGIYNFYMFLSFAIGFLISSKKTKILKKEKNDKN